MIFCRHAPLATRALVCRCAGGASGAGDAACSTVPVKQEQDTDWGANGWEDAAATPWASCSSLQPQGSAHAPADDNGASLMPALVISCHICLLGLPKALFISALQSHLLSGVRRGGCLCQQP